MKDITLTVKLVNIRLLSNINKNETRLNNKEISLSQKLKNNLLKVIESFDQDIV